MRLACMHVRRFLAPHFSHLRECVLGLRDGLNQEPPRQANAGLARRHAPGNTHASRMSLAVLMLPRKMLSGIDCLTRCQAGAKEPPGLVREADARSRRLPCPERIGTHHSRAFPARHIRTATLHVCTKEQR
jgi:hypothetical protein